MFSQYLLSTFAVFVPVLYTLGEVDSQPVWSVQSGDVLQVGWAEHSDDTVSTTTEDEVLADCQTARRRRLTTFDLIRSNNYELLF